MVGGDDCSDLAAGRGELAVLGGAATVRAWVSTSLSIFFSLLLYLKDIKWTTYQQCC
jgi:hypothetical protein